MLTKLVRLGRDSEVRFLQDGTPVASLACVYDIGFGDKKRSQWIDVSLWGKQAEALSEYLTKGKQIVIYANDVEIETYQKNDGAQGSKLKARAVNIDLCGGGEQQAQPSGGYQAQPQQGYQPAQQKAQPQAKPRFGGANSVNPMSGGDFDDDIPFMRLCAHRMAHLAI